MTSDKQDGPYTDKERQILAYLLKNAKFLKRRGPKVKWTPSIRAKLLAAVDLIKQKSKNPDETDKSAVQRVLSAGFAKGGISERALLNAVSKSRTMAKNGELPVYTGIIK
jgi:hypothetical protein